MASLISFTSLVFVLVYILHESAANIQQATDKIDVAAGRNYGLSIDMRGSPSSVEKLDNVDGVPTPQEAAGNHLGRKMMKRRFLMKQMAAAKDTMIITRQVSKLITSAAATHHSNSVKGKKKLSTMKVKRASDDDDDEHVKKDDLSSFVTLNADYHPPKSHPPKNN